jgi:hypothetical protein
MPTPTQTLPAPAGEAARLSWGARFVATGLSAALGRRLRALAASGFTSRRHLVLAATSFISRDAAKAPRPVREKETFREFAGEAIDDHPDEMREGGPLSPGCRSIATFCRRRVCSMRRART